MGEIPRTSGERAGGAGIRLWRWETPGRSHARPGAPARSAQGRGSLAPGAP